MNLLYAGWDVAGWRSHKHALSVASWDTKRATLAWLSLQQAMTAKSIHAEIDDLSAKHPGTMRLGIDAPLSYPAAFTQWAGNPMGLHSTQLDFDKRYAELAYRVIDTELKEKHGLQPLSASFTYLGGPASLAIHIAAALRTTGWHWIPVDTLDDPEMDGLPNGQFSTFMETYPASFKRITMSQHRWVIAQLPSQVQADYIATYCDKRPKSDKDNHMLDACLCAITCFCIHHTDKPVQVIPPAGVSKQVLKEEGWLYAVC